MRALICPVSGLSLEKTVENGRDVYATANREHVYPLIDGCVSLIPETLPQELQSKSVLWAGLQKNGEISYSLAPDLNLTKDEIVLAQMAEFMAIGTDILDIGCGPQKDLPEYIPIEKLAGFVGLDPLVGEQPRQFEFIHGIAELLPFSSVSFDSIIFCNSLDHMLDFEKCLKESSRVARAGGRIYILMDDVVDKVEGSGFLSIIRKGINQFTVMYRLKGLAAAVRYALTISKLEIPEGAMDYFHSYFPGKQEVVDVMNELGVTKVRELQLGESVLLEFIKNGVD